MSFRAPKLFKCIHHLGWILLVIVITFSCTEEHLEPDALTVLSEVSSAAGEIITLSNPGFENDWSGWNDTDPSSISGDTNSGSKSAKITGSNGGFTQTVSLNSNTEYILSAYVKGSWRIGVNVGGTRTTRSGNASDWEQETVTFNTNSNISTTILAEYNAGEGRLDDFALIQGSSSNPSTGNLALAGTASQSSTGYSGSASRAIDGNTNGRYNNGSVTHTANSDGSPWWQVDLGTTKNIGEIRLFNRTDCCSNRLSNFTVSVLNNSGTTTFSQTFTTQPSPSLTIDAGGASGSTVRVALNVNNRLSLAEVEVYEGSGSPTGYTSIPAKIEAEDFDDATEGRTESVSDGNDNTLNVGWIDAGESLSYNINVPTSGTYTIDFRVASLNQNIRFDVLQGSTFIGSINSNATGGWQTWKTIETDVSLSAGNQTIKLVAIGGGWNINWLSFNTGGSSTPPSGTLDPNKAPSENFDLSQWKLTLTSAAEITTEQLNNGYTLNNQFYTNNSDGGMVFKNYPAGPDAGTTSNSTQYSRVEFREMLRGTRDWWEANMEDDFGSYPSTQGINKNNWVFGSSSSTNRQNAGGVDGEMNATLEVNRVTVSGDNSRRTGRVVIGQIHASENEPCRLYFHKQPGHTNGAIYFGYEPNSGSEVFYTILGDGYLNSGGDYDGAGNPSDGISLNERFGYQIKVVGNLLTVTIYDANGNFLGDEDVNMSSGDLANDWMYFKAGLYSQNDGAQSSNDFEQVTFYSLDVSHD